MIEDINKCIRIIQSMLIDNKRVTFNSDNYLEFKDLITNYVYNNHLEETIEWTNISQNMIYKSNEYLSDIEANNILVNLEKLKRICFQNIREIKIFDEQIHPLIAKVCKTKYFDGYYADAVESAFKEINFRCKSIYKLHRNEEKDGVDLMNNIFSPNHPLLEFEDNNTESGANIQQGYMQIFAGAILAIRNPKAHENQSITQDAAYKRLIFASLLMSKIDEAVNYSKISEN